MKLLHTLTSIFTPAPRIDPRDAAKRVGAGTAVLVDVRESAEWRGGVADGAALLPLSDLGGARALWQPFLREHEGRELLLYCASGGRSGMAARLLAGENFRTMNAGGLDDLRSGGWRIVKPD